MDFGKGVTQQEQVIFANYFHAHRGETCEHQRGCLMEERVLKGDLKYESSMERLQGDEERFVLLAMHQTLVERGVRSPEGERK